MAGAKKPAFDWDDANTGHISRHNVTRIEAEEALSGASLPLDAEERGGEKRHAELGETSKGRLLVVVWTWRRRKIRIVTAFPANRKWRVFWRRLKKGGPNA